MKEQNKSRKPKPKFGQRPDKPFLPCLLPTAGKIIGITGGIATGKSFVLECFRKLGFAVFSADDAVHELLKRNGKAFEQVAALIPNAVSEEGIDRKVLGEVVYGNQEKLQKLEAIIHPLVRDAQVAFLVKIKATSGKSCVFEVPLLYENQREKYYDYIVVTTAPKEVQKNRAMTRKNMTEEKFDAIISKQLDDSIKVKKAHFVINTGRTPEITYETVRNLVLGKTNDRNNSRHRNNGPKRQRRGQNS